MEKLQKENEILQNLINQQQGSIERTTLKIENLRREIIKKRQYKELFDKLQECHAQTNHELEKRHQLDLEILKRK